MARTADPNVRTTILQAARTVFQQKGYADARMADIAAQANVAVGTIYLYFTTKEALVSTLAANFYHRLHQEAIPLLYQADFVSALTTTLHTTLRIMHEQRDLLAMIYLRIGLAAFAEPSEVEVQVTQAFAAALQERIARGEARPINTEKAALLIMGLLERAALIHAVEGEATMAQLEETLVHFVQQALLPEQRLQQ